MKTLLFAILILPTSTTLIPDAQAYNLPGRYQDPCAYLQGTALWNCVNAPYARPTPRSNRCADLQGTSLWNCINGPYNLCDEFRGNKRFICQVQREQAPRRHRRTR